MATGTIIPSPKFTGFDANGNPLAGGKLYTYVAGTPSDPQTTYSNVELTSANANPVVLDSAGVATVFVSAGTSFKYVLKDSADVLIWSADNIGAVPKSTATLDVTVTAGEALSALDAVYISQGDGSKTTGSAYQTDADETYSSSLAITIGLAPAAIASGETGSIRLGGALGGYTGLTAGSTQYVSATAGALTGTAPTNVRIVGQAVSTTEVMLASNAESINDASIIAGGIAIASQAANEIIYASSATQLTRSSTLNYDGTKLGVGVSSPAFEPFTAISSAAGAQATICSTHATYTGSALKVGAVRAASSAYNLIYTATGTASGGSSGTASFIVRGDGQTTITGVLGIGTSSPAFKPFTAISSDASAQATINSTHASYTGSVLKLGTVRAAGTAFNLLYMATGTASGGSSGAAQFIVRGDGQTTTTGNLGVGTTTPGTSTAATGIINSVNSIRAWARVKVQNAPTPGTPELVASFNVASLTDNGVGETTITFTTDMPHVNYAVLVTIDDDYPKPSCVQSAAVGSVKVLTFESDFTTPYDSDWYVAIISD